MLKVFGLVMVVWVSFMATPWAQSLSDQVLQLLLRDNTWVGEQSFQDMRVPLAAIPGDTTVRIYADLSGNLYYNGGLIAGAGGGVTPHNLLSTTHPDTLTASPVRGSLIVGNSTPKWSALVIGASGTFLKSNGTDAAWSSDGSSLTALNASSLASGTVALARLPTTIANAQIDAAAAIAWTKISKTGSSLADLTTRSAADLSSGTLLDARLSSNVSLFGSSVGTSEIDASAITSGKLADFGCTAGQAMTWQLTGWTCGTFGTGAGTVTSVALSLPAFITVTGSPVTTTGTLTGTLATQTANTFFSGPSSAGPSAPTFRAIVNADLPLSGAAAGTYSLVTINTAGVVTVGATAAFTNISGTLGIAKGGTGLTAMGDDTVVVGDAAAAATARTLPNCTTTPLGYTQATNTFSCLTTLSGMTLLSGTTVTGGTVNATASLVVGSGSSVTKIVTGTTTYDPGAISDQTSVTTTLAVTGAAVGQVCTAALSTIDAENLAISAFPSAGDTVRVVIVNVSGGPLSPGSGTLRATCVAH